jgi:paraquat-inducible protein B
VRTQDARLMRRGALVTSPCSDMSKKASPTILGVFVLLGLALAVAGVLVFSGAKLFQQPHRFILYFDGSVKGLSPGAAVMINGVRIGTVKEVLIRLNQHEDDLTMPVIIEVDASILKRKTDRFLDLDDDQARGLRARLEAESMGTGLLYVDLGVRDNPGPPIFRQVTPVYREIPTQPNTIQGLMDNLAHFDARGLSERLDSLLARLDESLGQLHVIEINQGLTNLLISLNTLVSSPAFTNTLAGAGGTMEELRGLAASLRAELPALATNAQQTLAELQRTAADVQQTSENLRHLVAPHAPLAHGIGETVEELGAASRALKDLAEYLQRNPNALLSGRARPASTP